MQIFQQLIESLKMELGILKVNSSQELSIKAEIHEPPISIEVHRDWETFHCSVKELLLPSKELMIKSFSQNQNVVRTDQVNLKKSVSVKNGSINSRICVEVLFQSSSLKENLRGENILFEGTKAQNLDLIESHVKEKNLPILKIMRFKPTPFPKTQLALQALENFLIRNKKEIDKLQFIGYYRSVPLESAKRYLIVEKDLVLELSQKESKRLDLFVFKYQDEYIFESIRRK
ncbi:MAG: hypothetical protein WHT65_07790 [Pseudothermotoga sp.]